LVTIVISLEGKTWYFILFEGYWQDVEKKVLFG